MTNLPKQHSETQLHYQTHVSKPIPTHSNAIPFANEMDNEVYSLKNPAGICCDCAGIDENHSVGFTNKTQTALSRGFDL